MSALKRLFTKEDRFGFHKILGCACLAQFAYRYFSAYSHITPVELLTVTDIGLIAMHVVLSMSSFLFHIEQKRNMANTVINREIQLHNIIFVSRSFTVLFALWLGLRNNILRACVMIPFHMLADYVTHKYGDAQGGTTIRSTEERDAKIQKFHGEKSYVPRSKVYKLYSSFCQLGAAYIQIASSWLHVYIVMFPIQIYTFLSTLRKKNVIGENMEAILYVISLTMVMLVAHNVSSYSTWVTIAVLSAMTLLRFHFKANKYVVFMLVAIVTEFLKKA